MADRQEFGHWEIDTVIGQNSNDQALLTLTERKTRHEIIISVNAKDAPSIRGAVYDLKKKYGEQFTKIFKTITDDNGSEFADLSKIVEKDETKNLFHPPHTSCERGANERHNGLIRRFIPKGKAISAVSDQTISYAETWCNQLPRWILGYKTPQECLEEELALLAS